jgi:micrococcal nuclease
VRLGARRTLVRLIGVDCPELHESEKLDRDAARSHRSRAAIEAMGARATAFTRDHLLGKTVDLELGVEQHDRYGRLLAYVWLPGGVLFNADLVRAGYAQPLTIPPNVKYARLSTGLAREARADGRGLWGKGLESLSRRGTARHPPRRWYRGPW